MGDEKKKRFINRLETRRVVHPMIQKMYSEGITAALAGKPVAWCMVNWWEGDLILRAMDVTPVYPENFGTVCAATGMAQKYLDISDAEGFPSHLCGYARNCFGYSAEMKRLGKVPPDAPLGGMPEPALMMASGAFCDARFKWFQALRQYWDVPVWTLEFPHPGSDESFMEGTHETSIKYILYSGKLLRKQFNSIS